MKGACKGEEGLVEGKAVDVSTQKSLFLHARTKADDQMMPV